MSDHFKVPESFAAKVNLASLSIQPVVGGGVPASAKKDPHDRTSTKRSQRLSAEMKATGGATVVLRLKTAEIVAQLDSLIDKGVGRDRSDVLRKLIASKFVELQKK